MENVIVKIHYQGVVRLLIKNKEDTFILDEEPDVEELVLLITEKYGAAVGNECRRQNFFVYPPGASVGTVLKTNHRITSGTLVKVASMVTGG